jgi:hypothetical protein
MIKQFNGEHHQAYYEGWIYLGTVDKQDYYIEALPTSDYPYPSMSIVYGVEPSEYISTTMPISSMLDNDICSHAIKFYVINNLNDMLQMITFVRSYAAKHGSK